MITTGKNHGSRRQGGEDKITIGGPKLDEKVLGRIKRAEGQIRPMEPKWQECLAFFDNEQYVEHSAIDGRLARLETREGSSSKPRHRVRLTRNRYTPAILREAAAVSARSPVYEVDPMNGDPVPVEGAKLAEKALLATYQSLGVKALAIDTAQYALTTGCGFTWPFWNADVGEFVVDEQGEILRTGEIGVWVLHQGEVMWQPGTTFYDSRWYIVRKAQPVEEITSKTGYIGPENMTTDAQSAPHERRRGEEQKDLVYVYHYLERPSKKHMNGRWLQIASGRLIAKPEDYPCDKDVPVLQWMPYVTRRHLDRPLGMGELMLDIQRTYNRTISQIVAYKNLVLNPQVFAPVGSLRQQLDDTPGAVWQYRPIAGLKPEWREMPDLPVGLFKTLDQCLMDWEEITGQHTIPSTVESGAGVQARDERDENRRAVFVGHVADWYAKLGEQFLYLMQKHYTEDRLLTIQGRFGTEQIEKFRGLKLHGAGQVRVGAGSIEPRGRAQQQAMVMGLVDKGLVDPQKAIMAMRAGTADVLIDDYELDRDKQFREIQQLIQMGTMKGDGVPMVDPDVDNHAVHLDVLKGWMKTRDFELQPPMVKEAAKLHVQWHRQVQMQEQMQQAQMQSAMAEQLGAQNAAAPQAAKPMPSQPSMESSTRAAQGRPSYS